ncbi:MAG: hypothetical protein WC924_04565 [Candidatus Gracilibacteria bacterium]
MQCTQCGSPFEQLPKEIEVYKNFDAVLPDNCPECRHRRHLIFRNERNIFYNTSAGTGKIVISMIPPTSKFKVIDQDEWWADSFDASIYAREFDFNRPFFDQFADLQKEVPRWARLFVNCENSEFTNNSAEVKDCYLTFSSYDSEKLFYCIRVFRSLSCVDCMNVEDSQYCSQCMDCQKCYNLHYSQSSKSCSDSYFLYDCKNCKDCILCGQLSGQSYCILNKQYSEKEYKKFKDEFLKTLSGNKKEQEQKLEALKRTLFLKNLRMINTENSLGDFVNDSKNIYNGFYVVDCEDCINIQDCTKLKDCYDNLANEKSELCLEVDTAYEVYNSKFCTLTVNCTDSAYLDQCSKLEESFGCVGMKSGQNLILNKKYSKEEYEKMLKRIREHMMKTGEWGHPFPAKLTTFPYNTTVAYEYYPLTKEEALRQGYSWDEEEKEAKHFGKEYEIPGDIKDVDETICEQILTCEETGGQYKVIPQELKFYKTFSLPIPRNMPYQRYKKLLSLQPPKKLINTVCAVCSKTIKTVYPKEKGYKIACEKCYLEKIYN